MKEISRKAAWGALVLATGSHMPAQSIQGSILGSVRDSTGAAVPGATVVVTDVDTSVHVTVTTDAAGDYQALDLTADHYSVTVTAAGFEAKLVKGLNLTARQQLREDVTLAIGSVGQEVTVNSGDAGVIATDTPSIDASLPAVEVRDLPANYRASVSGTSPLSIIQVLPGVQADNSGNFSVQGGLPFQTEVSVDGVTVQNTTSNTPLPDAFPSGDSIAEIRVDGVLNNAEFGQPGEVTTITKSGTNDLHGAVFYYHQDSGEQAKPFGALTKPKLVTNDFGGSAGGPVFIPRLYNGRNRTFFFGTYEGYRSPRTGVVQYSVPTVAMKGGNFSGVQGVKPLKNPFTGGTYANYTVPHQCLGCKLSVALPRSQRRQHSHLCAGRDQLHRQRKHVTVLQPIRRARRRVPGQKGFALRPVHLEEHQSISSHHPAGAARYEYQPESRGRRRL